LFPDPLRRSHWEKYCCWSAVGISRRDGIGNGYQFVEQGGGVEDEGAHNVSVDETKMGNGCLRATRTRHEEDIAKITAESFVSSSRLECGRYQIKKPFITFYVLFALRQSEQSRRFEILVIGIAA
jgi:hypothetical protein